MVETKDTYFICESGSSVHIDWGKGDTLELCSLGQNAEASRHCWQVPLMPSYPVSVLPWLNSVHVTFFKCFLRPISRQRSAT